MVTGVELADLPAPAWSSFWQLAGAICYPFCPFTPPLPVDWPSGVVGQSLGLSILVALLTLGVSLLWIGSAADNDQIFVTSPCRLVALGLLILRAQRGAALWTGALLAARWTEFLQAWVPGLSVVSSLPWIGSGALLALHSSVPPAAQILCRSRVEHAYLFCLAVSWFCSRARLRRPASPLHVGRCVVEHLRVLLHLGSWWRLFQPGLVLGRSCLTLHAGPVSARFSRSVRSRTFDSAVFCTGLRDLWHRSKSKLGV